MGFRPYLRGSACKIRARSPVWLHAHFAPGRRNGTVQPDDPGALAAAELPGNPLPGDSLLCGCTYVRGIEEAPVAGKAFGRVRRYARGVADRIYTERLSAELAGKPRPKHVGIMLDGNRRWAKSVGHDDPSEGYKVGGAKVLDFLTWCRAAGIEHVTLFMLSDDNLHRPADELAPLIAIIEKVVEQIAQPGLPWEIEVIGALDLLPAASASRLKDAANLTKGRQTGTKVDIAVGYGGRREIADAVRAAFAAHSAEGGDPEELISKFDVDDISKNLYSTASTECDLIIRTSGEQRLSGFLLWQSAYAEVYFCECYWPDFRQMDFLRALRSFSLRDRRYGR
jgi:short-chain Z-isoprenyl diphosphate synthase